MSEKKVTEMADKSQGPPPANFRKGITFVARLTFFQNLGCWALPFRGLDPDNPKCLCASKETLHCEWLIERKSKGVVVITPDGGTTSIYCREKDLREALAGVRELIVPVHVIG